MGTYIAEFTVGKWRYRDTRMHS